MSRVSCVYYAPNHRVRRGDTFRLRYGRIGSRSGPCYYISTTGEAVTVAESSADENGDLIAELDAVQRGQATIIIDVKQQFLEQRQRDSEFTLEVE